MKYTKGKFGIEKVNYFPELEDKDFNAKVLYWEKGKLNLAHIYIDFFNESIYFPKQPKECKKLTLVIQEAIHDYATETKWLFS